MEIDNKLTRFSLLHAPDKGLEVFLSVSMRDNAGYRQRRTVELIYRTDDLIQGERMMITYQPLHIIMGVELYMRLTDEEREAVVAHELAHSYQSPSMGFHEREYHADRYSMMFGAKKSKVISCLLKDGRKTSFHQESDSHPSIYNRILALENL